MIGLDTNILVRYLAQDDPVQSRKAREILERRPEREKNRLRQRCGDGRDCLGPRRRLRLVIPRNLRGRRAHASDRRPHSRERARGFHSHGGTKEGRELICRCSDRGALRPSRLCSYPDIRPQGAPPPGLRASVSGPWSTEHLDRSIGYACDAGVTQDLPTLTKI